MARLSSDMEAGMARADSQDLRDRAIKTALGGVFVRQAAARYGVGISTAIVWVRYGSIRRKQSAPAGSAQGFQARCACSLSPGPDRGHLHISLQEMQVKLREERGVCADIGTLWRCISLMAKLPLTPKWRAASVF